MLAGWEVRQLSIRTDVDLNPSIATMGFSIRKMFVRINTCFKIVRENIIISVSIYKQLWGSLDWYTSYNI